MPKIWDEKETLNGIEKFQKYKKRTGERRKVLINPALLKTDRRKITDRRL